MTLQTEFSRDQISYNTGPRFINHGLMTSDATAPCSATAASRLSGVSVISHDAPYPETTFFAKAARGE